MPVAMLEKLPGYGPDVAAHRDKAREIMKKLGYGPDKRMNIKVTTLRSATASVLAFAGLQPSSTHRGRSFVAVVPGILPTIVCFSTGRHRPRLRLAR
jgi:hypothetical protein